MWSGTHGGEESSLDIAASVELLADCSQLGDLHYNMWNRTTLLVSVGLQTCEK